MQSPKSLVLATTLLFTAGEAADAYVTIRSKSGATAQVASVARPRFQCLVDRLDSLGYKIHFMGGYRKHGSIKRSKHPLGLAIDINQTARDRVTRRFPPGIADIARGCGLVSGSVWRWRDTGHFEYPGRYAELRSGVYRSQWASKPTLVAAARTGGNHGPKKTPSHQDIAEAGKESSIGRTTPVPRVRERVPAVALAFAQDPTRPWENAALTATTAVLADPPPPIAPRVISVHTVPYTAVATPEGAPVSVAVPVEAKKSTSTVTIKKAAPPKRKYIKRYKRYKRQQDPFTQFFRSIQKAFR